RPRASSDVGASISAAVVVGSAGAGRAGGAGGCRSEGPERRAGGAGADGAVARGAGAGTRGGVGRGGRGGISQPGAGNVDPYRGSPRLPAIPCGRGDGAGGPDDASRSGAAARRA